MFRFVIIFFIGLCATIGASAATWYVNAGASGTGTGESWTNAFTDIQSAINAASIDGGGEIWVAAGTYTAPSDPVVAMATGVHLYGGFAGVETARIERNWKANLTTIDGENARRCVIGADNATLDGFTITRGYIAGHGGGMYNYLASPAVVNCFFRNNQAAENNIGGGMYNSEAAPVVTNCVFYRNTAYCGGGMGNYKSAAIITNCTFNQNAVTAHLDPDNPVDQPGGGMFNSSTPKPIVTNCILSGNVQNNFTDSDAPTTSVTYSDVLGWVGGVGNLNINPRLVNPAAANLRLQSISPCINAGNNAAVTTTTDLDGNTRMVGAVDMGAYEFFAFNALSVTPTPNFINAPADTNVTVTVDTDLGTVNPTTNVFSLYSLTSPLLNSTNVSLSYDNANPYVLTLDPANGLRPGDRLFADFHNGDFGVKPYVWEFRTAVGTNSTGIFADSMQRLGNSAAHSVALGDVNGDGYLDAFVVNNAEPNQVWFNDGTGAFTDSGQSLGYGENGFDAALGDLDNDGDLDAFVTNDGQPNTVWINLGDGTFMDSGQSLIDSNTILRSNDVDLGDLDGDGDLDALVSMEGPPSQIWFNDGSGTFSDGGQAGIWSSSSAVALGDLDGDGDLDAIAAGKDFNFSRVILNNGVGHFDDADQEFCAGQEDVALGDLDGDGDLDAFFVSTAANSVWLNNGAGVFSNSGQALGNAYSNAVALGDVDADGDLDAFVANFGGPSELWLNNGAGVFSETSATMPNTWGFDLAMSDLNGDGALDVYIANYTKPDEVWFNTSRPVVTTNAPSDFNVSSATLNGEVVNQGTSPVIERGFYWSDNPMDTGNLSSAVKISISPDPGGTGPFSFNLNGLTLGNTYYFIAFAVNAQGTNYGAEQSFKTKLLPTITWGEPTPITYGTALSGVQLNASANIPGLFLYSPVEATILSGGLHTLKTTFTPDDSNTYSIATATVSLMVNKAVATVTLDNLSQTYDGTPKSATVTTIPPGLSVDITYDGLPALPVAPGSYAVIATVNDQNYEGNATGALTIQGQIPIEIISVNAFVGQNICLEVPNPGTAQIGDFSWTFTPVGGDESGVPDAVGPEFCLNDVQESNSGRYIATYNNSAKAWLRTAFDLSVQVGAPLTGMLGIVAMSILTACGGALHLRKKRK